MKTSEANTVEGALGLRAAYLLEVRRLLQTHLPNEEVWAYGSRVNGGGHEMSDLDLAVRHPADLSARQGVALAALRAAFSDSNLPLIVDLHDWASLPKAFQDNIAASHIVLYTPTGTVPGED